MENHSRRKSVGQSLVLVMLAVLLIGVAASSIANVLMTSPLPLPQPTLTLPQDAKRIETASWPRNFMLKGRWLAWTVLEPQSSMYQYSIYDVINARTLQISNTLGRAAWLESDYLYILRPDSESSSNNRKPRESLYRIALPDGTEKLVESNLLADSLVNQRYVVSIGTTPDVCLQARSCMDSYGFGCGLSITKFDLTTKERKLIFVQPIDTFLSGMTDSLIVMSNRMAGCDIKAHWGPIRVLDLDTGEYRAISPSSTSPGPDIYTAGMTGRTIVYLFGPDHTRVVRIEPHEGARLLMDADGITGLGLAGADILLFSRELRGYYAPGTGLYAVNLRTGEQQAILTGGYVRSATGDEQHVAWLTDSGELYITSLNLSPSKPPDFLKSPLPTLEPALQPPLAYPLTPEPYYTPTPMH